MRAQHVDLPPAGPSIVPGTGQSGIEFAFPECMSSKDFTDPSGLNWRVWNTIPISGAVINPGFERGWLTFESDAGTLRRLAPIPAGWEDLSMERLVDLLGKANEVPRHTGPMRQVPRPNSESEASGR
jgi:hypothetical protein